MTIGYIIVLQNDLQLKAVLDWIDKPGWVEFKSPVQNLSKNRRLDWTTIILDRTAVASLRGLAITQLRSM